MPRFERLEYEDAIYHVMNRGRGCQKIFHDQAYYQAFEETLKESRSRHGAIIHAYCFMNNHYHLLIQTPRANLSRIMRHINGVYTQRYNRLKGTDGPLYRGRFKSLLVEDDIYALYVSRYIHRNPVETKHPIVSSLEQYTHSSYPAYINKQKAPEWLERNFIYELEGSHHRYQGMKTFVETGVDTDTARIYKNNQWPMVYGSSDYRKWIYEVKLPEKDAPQRARVLVNTPDIAIIVAIVSRYYGKKEETLYQMKRAKGYQNKPRDVSIYLSQVIGDKKLTEIAPVFGYTHPNSVSYVTSRFRSELKTNKKLRQQIDEICILIIDHVT